MRARATDREGVLSRLMLLPAIVYILALVAAPFVIAIAYSFSDVTAGNPSYDWVGLENYRANLDDPVFGQALWNTFLFTAATMVLTVVFANIVALLLTAEFKAKRWVRFLVLLPWTTPAAIGAIAWLFLLDSLLSPIDWILQQVGLLDDNRHMVWLGRSGLAKASVIGVQVWRLVPLAAVIIMAGQTAIPDEINDAAAVDGAGFWRRLWEVTLPLTLPVIAVAVLFGAIITFTDMSLVRVLTNGAPTNETQVLASWAYVKGIDGGNLAQGAAVAVFLLPLLLAATIAILRAVRRWEVT
ncbi:MAG TPA: sugar ABC transporter permease [Acidimicrobiales bacterium]|nr:sugar ABC transporter permease [Acidimicrobiales bacterium]